MFIGLCNGGFPLSRNFYVRTDVNFMGVNKIETKERFRVPFTANVKLMLRIAQNRKRSAKNSSKQLL